MLERQPGPIPVPIWIRILVLSRSQPGPSPAVSRGCCPLRRAGEGTGAVAAAGHTVALALHPSRGCGERQPVQEAKQAVNGSVRSCGLGSFPAPPRPLWIIQTRPICSCPCPCPFSHTQRFWMPGLPLARDVGQEFVSKMTRPGVCREQSLSCCSANEHRDKPDSPKPFHPRKWVLSSLRREKITIFT